MQALLDLLSNVRQHTCFGNQIVHQEVDRTQRAPQSGYCTRVGIPTYTTFVSVYIFIRRHASHVERFVFQARKGVAYRESYSHDLERIPPLHSRAIWNSADRLAVTSSAVTIH